MKSVVKILCGRIGYTFNNPDLIDLALTHRSMGGKNNERLEFLGDAALGFFIADELYCRFPTASEGDMTRLRALLVKGETLATLAQGLGIGEFIHLGSGELKSGGFRRASILACTMEALIGAAYLDGGFSACRQMLLSVYKEMLAEVSPERVTKDPKTRLQEWLQARKSPLPTYNLLKVKGESHAQQFFVECLVAGLKEGTQGEGRSRRTAEQQAAQQAYERLTELNN